MFGARSEPIGRETTSMAGCRVVKVPHCAEEKTGVRGPSVDILFEVTTGWLWIGHCHAGTRTASAIVWSFTVARTERPSP